MTDQPEVRVVPTTARAPGQIGAKADPPTGAAVHWLCMLLIAGAVLAVYAPALVASYGYADDYLLLWGSSGSAGWMQRIYDSAGRPLLGYATHTVLGWAGSVENLRFVRLGIAAQLVLLCGMVYFHLLRMGARPVLAVLTAVFIATFPPSQIQVSWATYVVMIAAAALTWVTYRLASVEAGFKSWQLYAGQLGAIFLTALVLATYQPSALFYWFWFAVEVLLVARPLRDDLWKLVRLAVPFALGGLGYYGWWKLRGLSGPRTNMAPDLLAKQVWFWREVVPNTFNFHMFHWPVSVGLGIAISAGVVILVLGGGRWQWRVGKLAIVAVLLPAAYATNLVVAAPLATYRTRMALMSLAAVLVCYALWLVLKQVGRLRRMIPAAVLGLLGLVLVARASYSVNHYMVWPQSVEYALVKSQLRAFDPRKHREVHFIHNRFTTRFTPDSYTMEFGVPTSNMPRDWKFGWAMARLAMRELFPEQWKRRGDVEIKLFTHNKPPEPDPRAVVVDMRRLQSFR